MKLIIAEKPSVARAIAQAVGSTAKHQGYLEGGGFIVTWCRGHLVELLPPDAYDEWCGAWDFSKLPMIPRPWRWAVPADAESQFDTVAELVGRADVDAVVNGCDPDREGEGIFRRVMSQICCDKPQMRLWSTALTPQAIRVDLERMRPEEEYDGLAASAEGRAKADWLVGMNASRAYASLYRCRLSAGRVQTPTLYLVAKRTREVEGFVSKPFFQAVLRLGTEDGFEVFGERFETGQDAEEAAADALKGPASIVSLERKTEKNRAPLLYDLTGLQKDASTLAGLTAERTLDALQSLYESRLATYPRSDSRYIGSADAESAARVLKRLCDDVLAGTPVVEAFDPSRSDVSRVVDDSKVHGHSAIVPTDELDSASFSALDGDRLVVMTLVCCRLLAATMEPATRVRTKLVCSAGGRAYEASGNHVADASWISVDGACRRLIGYRQQADDEADAPQEIPSDLEEGALVAVADARVKEGKTAPPKLYTDATLLAAMAHAGRQIDDAELRRAIDDDSSHSAGLGTPATRAAIIEKLIADGYVRRRGKSLVATDQGITLVDAVSDSLKSPVLTAEWERELSRVEHGEADLASFLSGIEGYAEQIVCDAKESYDPAKGAALAGRAVIGACPKCGKPVVRTGGVYQCSSNRNSGAQDGYKLLQGCGFKLYVKQLGKPLTDSQASKLLAGRQVHMTGLKKRDGSTFDADVRLEDPPFEKGWVVFCTRAEGRGAGRRKGPKARGRR